MWQFFDKCEENLNYNLCNSNCKGLVFIKKHHHDHISKDCKIKIGTKLVLHKNVCKSCIRMLVHLHRYHVLAHLL